ncbi:hypothetical protein EJB05_44307, partial [Eragrostis curvula]
MRGRAHLGSRGLADLRKMTADALARSQGQCEAFSAEGTGLVDDNFLLFLADRAPLLKSLTLNSCREVTHKGFIKAIERFPLLDELELSMFSGVDTGEVLKDIALVCPRLKHLSLIDAPYIICGCCGCYMDLSNDREAMAIATMHELRSLQLLYNDLSNQGLEAILDNCPHLESLDMQKCRHIIMDDIPRAKCARIKTLKLLVYYQHAKDDYFRDFEVDAIECSTCASYFRQHIGDKSRWWSHWSTSKANVKAKMVITTVHELRSLELHCKGLTTQGLRGILEKCPHLETKDILRCRNIVVKNALESYRQKIEPDGSDIGECSTCLMIEYLSWKVLDPNGHSDYYDHSYGLDSIDEKVWDSDEHSDYNDPSYGLDSIDETSSNLYDLMLHKRLRRHKYLPETNEFKLNRQI